MLTRRVAPGRTGTSLSGGFARSEIMRNKLHIILASMLLTLGLFHAGKAVAFIGDCYANCDVVLDECLEAGRPTSLCYQVYRNCMGRCR
jgi:hypothetical protein